MIAIFCKLHSCSLLGLNGVIIDVEVDVRNQGLPAFDLVGLPDAAVREARERVSLAVKNSGLAFPEHRLVVNLAPADLRKEGSAFDLALALGILGASGQIEIAQADKLLLIGELSLDGLLRPVQGVLSMVISAHARGFEKVFLPKGNCREAALVEGISVYPFESLNEVIDHLLGRQTVDAYSEKVLPEERRYSYDFADIRGQQGAKRAMEVAAAGGHNLLMVGGPGSGKTLMARSLPSILPELSFAESLQITQIYSVAGLLKNQDSLITERPFRGPHHSISNAGLIGGGSNPRPGEVSLAHHGVLFLDELPEFRRDVLELLRQPLEDRDVTIARVSATYTYPASFMLIASMNPCPCGFLGDPLQECSCRESEIRRYQGRISGPLLDRIDLQIEVPRLSYDELSGKETAEKSVDIRKRVEAARQLQRERLGPALFCNAQMQGKQVRQYCRMEADAASLLRLSFEQLRLSARAHDRILKVARTIADLASSATIRAEHIAEAVSYRSLDKQYFR